MYYPKEYSESDIQWLKDNFEPEYQLEVKKRKSTSARYLRDNEEIPDEIELPKELLFDLEQVYIVGGTRLVQLYTNNVNFELTANQLNISETALRQYVRHIGQRLTGVHITKRILERKLLNFD